MRASLIRRVSRVLAAVALVLSGPAHAGWPTTPDEDLVLSLPAGNGKQLRWLIPDGSGGVYVGWQDYATNPSNGDLRILRLDADGDVAPGWPAEGLIPPRPSIRWSQAALAADGRGGLFGAWPVGPTVLPRLALVRIGPDGALAPDWPASVDVAFGSYADGFPHLRLVVDAAGVYIYWSGALQRRSNDGTLAPGWIASGKRVDPGGEKSLGSDGGTGVFLASRDLVAHVLHFSAQGTPGPGWTSQGVTFPLVGELGPYPPPIRVSPTGGVFTFGSGLRFIEGDGAVPVGWLADGIGLGSSDFLLDMTARADGSLLYLFTHRSETPPNALVKMMGALAPDGSLPAGWPAGGRPLGDCFTPFSLRSDDGGVTVIGRGCGQPVPLEARRFLSDGTPSPAWPAPAPIANASLPVGSSLELVSTRDDLGGEIVGWSTRDYAGRYTVLRLKRLRGDGSLGADAVAAVGPARASGLALAAPTPNPAHGPTVLAFDLPRAMRASVALFDLAGRRVRTLVDGQLPAGRSAPRWDGRDDAGRALPAGVYLALLSTDEGTRTRRVALLP